MRHLPTGRGHHHKSSSTTHAHWLFDEPSGAPRDAIGAVALAEVATPGVATDGWLGPAYRTLNGTTQAFAGATTPSASVLTASAWTIGLVWRRRASAAGTILCYGNNSGLATGNVLARLKMSSAGALTFEWEDAGVVLRTQTVATYVLPLNRWTYLHIVRTGATSVQVWAGARLLATLAMTAANSGGSLSTWFVGENEDGTGKIQGDVGSLFVEAKAMTQTEMVDDLRRATLQKFATTVRARVKIKNAAGTYQDFTNLQGHDWVESISISADADTPCETMEVGLTREHDLLSLANLVTSSKLNLTNVADLTSYSPAVEVSREILCDMARVPLGFEPVTADWCGRFHGNIDDVDWGVNPVRVSCRDDGGLLVDDFLRVDIEMPVTSGVACAADGTTGERRASMEEALQDILNKFSGASAPTLYARDAANLCLIPWEQKKDSIMSACQAIASVKGWAFKYQFDEAPSQKTWRPTLFDPGRDRVDADCAFTLDDYPALTKVAKSVHDIRNNVYVIFADKLNVNSDDIKITTGGDTPYTDSTSKAAYGGFWRSIFITEGDTSPIDEQAEADTMGAAILSDLKDPVIDVGVALNDCFFEAEVGDIGVFAGDNIHYTAAQNLASSSTRLEYSDGTGNVTLGLRGKPTLGTRVWLLKDARPGMNDAPWSNAATSSAQNPNHGKGRADVVAMTDFLMTKTRWASGMKGGLLKNPDFDRRTLGTGYMPNNWFFHNIGAPDGNSPFNGVGSAYKTGAAAPTRLQSGTDLTVVTANRSGSYAMKFAAAAGEAMSSDFVSVEENQIYALEAVVNNYNSSPGYDGPRLIFWVEWYDSARDFISDEWSNRWKMLGPEGWGKVRSTYTVLDGGPSYNSITFTAPADARFARVCVIHGSTYEDRGSGLQWYPSAYETTLDTLNMFLIAREHFAYRDSSTQTGIATSSTIGTMTTVEFNAEDYDYGGSFDATTNFDWDCPEDGIWELVAQLHGRTTVAAGTTTFRSFIAALYGSSPKLEMARASVGYEEDVDGLEANGTVQVKFKGYFAKGENVVVRAGFNGVTGTTPTQEIVNGKGHSWFRAKLGQLE